MRQKLIISPLRNQIISRTHSSTSKPLVNITDVKAPTGGGRIRILSLARPSARNAISRQLLWELRSHIDAVAGEYDADGEELPPQKRFGGAIAVDQTGPTRALILTSEVDSCFCAGADLKERGGFSTEEYLFHDEAWKLLTQPELRTAAFLLNLRKTFTCLSTLPIPTISAISSLALGGGLELALSTNMRVLASTAIVGLPETRLGIIPGAGGTHRLPALIGLGRARDLILTGRRVTAAEAYFLGIADRLVEIVPQTGGNGEGESKEQFLRRANDETLREAIRLGSEICEGGPIAIRSALKAVSYAQEHMENKMYERVVTTEDRNEALAAFKEKRKPKFIGK